MKSKRSPKKVRKIMYGIRNGLLIFSLAFIIIFIVEFYLVDFNASELFGKKVFFLSPFFFGILGFYGLYLHQFQFSFKKIEEAINKN